MTAVPVKGRQQIGWRGRCRRGLWCRGRRDRLNALREAEPVPGATTTGRVGGGGSFVAGILCGSNARAASVSVSPMWYPVTLRGSEGF